MMSKIFHLLKFQEFINELFYIGKNRILNPLEILRISQNIWPRERPW